MARSFRVVISRDARADLRETLTYIRLTDSKSSARHVKKGITQFIRKLHVLPPRHVYVGVFRGAPCYVLPKWSWKIYYDVHLGRGVVRVVAIISARRSPEVHARIVSSR